MAKASSSGATVVDVCGLISAAKAAQLSGQPYTTATPETGNFGSQCAYNNDDSTAQGVNLGVDNQNVDNTLQLVHSGSVTDVSGVGDKAVWDNDNTLCAVSGSLIIQVNGLDSQDKSVALAKPSSPHSTSAYRELRETPKLGCTAYGVVVTGIRIQPGSSVERLGCHHPAHSDV